MRANITYFWQSYSTHLNTQFCSYRQDVIRTGKLLGCLNDSFNIHFHGNQIISSKQSCLKLIIKSVKCKRYLSV